MSRLPRNWTPNQLKFINLIKENPVIYTLKKSSKNKRKERKEQKEKNAWENIAKIMDSRPRACQRRWSYIELQYGKLKVLQANGKLPKELNEAYAVTVKYFDGTLSFLDPHLGDLSNPKMLKKYFPSTKRLDILVGNLLKRTSYMQVLKLIEKEKKIKSSDGEVLSLIDDTYIMKIMSVAVNASLASFFLVKGTEDIANERTAGVENEGTKHINSCNYIVEHNNKSSKGKTIDRLNLGEKTEFAFKTPNEFETEDNLIDVEECDTVEYSSGNAVRVDYINTMSSKKYGSMKIINKDSESDISDGKMRQFFEELGLTMSFELSLEKQIKLQMQINALVKSTLS